MTKAFENKVIRYGVIDTAKYRYIIRERYGLENVTRGIYRLPIASLDTTDAVDGWELVKLVEG